MSPRDLERLVDMLSKHFAPYMICGKTVESDWTGDVFKLIEDMDTDKGTTKAVNIQNWNRYNLLGAWIQNWEQDRPGFRANFARNFSLSMDEVKEERQGYEEVLKLSCIKPHDKIRFITVDYKPKFSVRDLSQISINGKAGRVAYIDENHFAFVDKFSIKRYGSCFHIAQFAELCEKNGIEVKPLEKPRGV